LKSSVLQFKKSTAKVETPICRLRIERAKTTYNLEKFRFLIEKAKAKELIFF